MQVLTSLSSLLVNSRKAEDRKMEKKKQEMAKSSWSERIQSKNVTKAVSEPAIKAANLI